MKTPIKFALLGCGRVSGRYVELFSQGISGALLVGCCDTTLVKAQTAAKGVGPDVQVFSSLEAMVSECQPDVVCVLTESGHHYEHACQVLDLDCHVVIEKPVTLLPEQAYLLAQKAKDKNLMASVVKQNRFNPAIKKLYEAVSSGRLGKIVTATIRLRWCRMQDYYEDGWHGTWAMDGGVINQQAIHHVDALNWICGPIESVSSVIANRLMKLEAEDTITAALKFQNGALGTIEATTAARPRDVEASLSVIGENGMVVVGGIALNQIDVWDFVDPIDEDKNVPVEYSQVVPNGYGLGHEPYLQEVSDRISVGDTTPVLCPCEAVKALEVIHALYASDEQNAWVRLADKPRSSRLGLATTQER